jgi:hypothetical protein
VSDASTTKSEQAQHPAETARRRWRRLALALGALLLIGLGGYALRSTRLFWDNPVDALVVDPEHLDFGEVWVQRDFRWTLPIRNTTNTDIGIRSFAASCGCTSVEPESIIVPTRSEVPVELVLDLRPGANAPLGQSRQEFAVSIIADAADAVGSHPQWKLTGMVRVPIEFRPMTLDFEDSLVEGMPLAARTVRVVCNEPVESMSVECDPEFATASCTELTDSTELPDSGAERFLIRVLPRDDLTVGEYEFDVAVQAVLADGTQTPVIGLPVRARILDDIRILPELSHLGMVAVGSEARETLRLESRRGEGITVESTEPDSDQITLERLERVSPTAWACVLRCSVEEEGEAAIPVRFHVRYDSGAASELRAVVRWLGVAAN